MIILGARRPIEDEAYEQAIYRAPNVWAHARAMSQWQKMGFMDQESFRLMANTIGPRLRTFEWIASIPLSVADIQNQLNPEIFQDQTGRAMLKFVERNPQFKPPKGHSRVSVSVPRTS